MGQYVLGKRYPWRFGSPGSRVVLIAALSAVVAWAAFPTPSVLYLAATLLIARKVIWDIGAFTEDSPRRVDWFSILVIAVLVIWIAMAIPAAEVDPISVPCTVCVTRPLA